MGSRLFDEIREQRGLVLLGLRGRPRATPTCRSLQLGAGLESSKCAEAYTRMREIVAELHADGPHRGGGRARPRVRRRPPRARVREHERRRALRGEPDDRLRRGHRPRRARSRCSTRSRSTRSPRRRAAVDPEHARRRLRRPARRRRVLEPSALNANACRRRAVGHNAPRDGLRRALNERELERYVAARRRPLAAGARAARRRARRRRTGARPQRERGAEYVVVLVSELFDGVPWLERVYQAGALWDAGEMGDPADVHCYTPARVRAQARGAAPPCATRPSAASTAARPLRIVARVTSRRYGCPTGRCHDAAMSPAAPRHKPTHASSSSPPFGTSAPSRRSSSATAPVAALPAAAVSDRSPRTWSSRRSSTPGPRCGTARGPRAAPVALPDRPQPGDQRAEAGGRGDRATARVGRRVRHHRRPSSSAATRCTARSRASPRCPRASAPRCWPSPSTAAPTPRSPQELGLTDGAVRQLVHRARTTLRGGVTAVTPLPLLHALMVASAGDSTVGRVAEVAAGAGGAGAASLSLKAGAAGGSRDRRARHRRPRDRPRRPSGREAGDLRGEGRDTKGAGGVAGERRRDPGRPVVAPAAASRPGASRARRRAGSQHRRGEQQRPWLVGLALRPRPGAERERRPRRQRLGLREHPRVGRAPGAAARATAPAAGTAARAAVRAGRAIRAAGPGRAAAPGRQRFRIERRLRIERRVRIERIGRLGIELVRFVLRPVLVGQRRPRQVRGP